MKYNYNFFLAFTYLLSGAKLSLTLLSARFMLFEYSG